VIPVRARVVEVIADLGEGAQRRYRYGSGCIVKGRTVLTSAHVVADAESVVVRDPDKREYAAVADRGFVGDVSGPGPDLALLDIADPAFAHDLPPIRLAAVDRDSATGQPVERCHVLGYPWFRETQSRGAVRDTVDAIGIVPVLSGLAAGLLSVQVSVYPRPLPPEQTLLAASEWSGVSGAPVVADGLLLGVVTEHAPREGSSAVMAVPLTALEADPAHPGWGPGVPDPAAWWSRLGVAGVGELQRLPVAPQRREPAYRATMREFGKTLHRRMPQLLGRERELPGIAAFATGVQGYRWLVGGPFAGKTALLYEALTAGLPDEVDVVCYFLSRRASDASSPQFLAVVVPQLAYLCGEDALAADVSRIKDQYYQLWQRAALRAEMTGRHLLLAVDGLDEDTRAAESPSVASLLPSPAGDHTHVLVTSRERPELPADVPDEHQLRATRPVPLTPSKDATKLADLARQEIDDLTHGPDADLAVEILGLLTAAAGPLSIRDLATLVYDGKGTPSAAQTRHVRRLVDERAARSLERVGEAANARYQFAHYSLLEYAQANEELRDPEYRERIHRWAEHWRDAGWPTAADVATGTPRYLIDTYAGTLAGDPGRLTALVGDVGWVATAIPVAGVDRILAVLRIAATARPPHATASAMQTILGVQGRNLRPPQPVDEPAYVLRQLCLGAMELREEGVAATARNRLRTLPDHGPVPMWTTRQASPALTGELGRHDSPVIAVAALRDGRVVTGTCPIAAGSEDDRVLVWDPATPGADPAELGHHALSPGAIAVLGDGRVVTCGFHKATGRHEVLIWDPAHPDAAPVELGRHDGEVTAVAVLGDGRVVTGGGSNPGAVLIWDLAHLDAAPVELGRHNAAVYAVAALGDGRVVTYGSRVYSIEHEVLVWDPAHPGAPVELSRHNADAVAVIDDGRVVTGGWFGEVLVCDTAHPGEAPVELGRHDGQVRAVAALGDGRVVTGGDDRRVLVWDPAHPGEAPVELGRHHSRVCAAAALGDGRVVTGGDDRRVLVWDPAQPGTAAGLSGHDGEVTAVAVLGDGKVITSSYDHRVLVWDPVQPGEAPVELGRHYAAAMAVLGDGRVVTGHEDVLMWDPAHPGAAPVKLGRHPGGAIRAVAVLGDGMVVGGGHYRVFVWDPAHPGADPVELHSVGGELSARAATTWCCPNNPVVVCGMSNGC
jgi:WD40 repeat protein